MKAVKCVFVRRALYRRGGRGLRHSPEVKFHFFSYARKIGKWALKVAAYCLALRSFAFKYSLPDGVAEKFLVQTSKSFISQQCAIWRQYSLLCQREKRWKIGYFGALEANWLINYIVKVSVLYVFLFNGQKNIFTTSLRNLYIGLRATLNLCKNNVSLNPMYRFFFKFGTLVYYVCKKKIYNFQRLSPTSFEVISLKRLKEGYVCPLLTLTW